MTSIETPYENFIASEKFRPPTYFDRDVTGEIFGKFEVLSHAGHKISRNGDRMHSVWRVRCINCDSFATRNAANVVRSKYGCSECKGRLMAGNNHYKWSGVGEITGYFVSKARAGAERKSRTLEFLVDAEYLNNVWIKQAGRCAYSGVKLEIGTTKIETTASLDRIDPSIGYVEGNVQFVHKKINTMKWDMTNYEFLSWIKIIYRNMETV